MKKLIALILALTLCVCVLAGCKQEAEDTAEGTAEENAAEIEEGADAGDEDVTEIKNGAGVVNPMIQKNTVEELKQETGVTLSIPDGAAVTSFTSINGEIAQMDFTYDGTEYCLRGKVTAEKEDISGMYYEWPETIMIDDSIGCEISTNGEQGVCLWYADGTSYAISATEGADAEKLEALYTAIVGAENAPKDAGAIYGTTSTADENQQDGEVLQAPPALTVTVNGNNSIEAMKGTYSWRYQDKDGMVNVEADSMHPLQSKEYMPYLEPAQAAASLTWSTAPDSITVRAWGEGCWDKIVSESTEVSAEKSETADGVSYTVELNEENSIYEIVAVWSRSEKYGGTASYSFYTVK